MSTVEYGAVDNGAGGSPAMHGGAEAYNSPPPQSAAPISSYLSGDGSAAGDSLAVVAVTGEKKKRGRPRKYPVVDGAVPIRATPTLSGKRMGRPPGSKNKPKVALIGGSSSPGFTARPLIVLAGEDISSKIMSMIQNGSGAICVLSAVGTVSNVTLRQATSSGGTITYEGRFEIISLTGSYTVLESGGQRIHNGGLRILLSGSDGQVLGGGVAGVLIAAAPVQVIVGGFSLDQELVSPKKADYPVGPSESSGSPSNSSGMMQYKS